MAISKTKPVEAIQEAYDSGHRIFGENYVQVMQWLVTRLIIWAQSNVQLVRTQVNDLPDNPTLFRRKLWTRLQSFQMTSGGIL